MAKKGQKRNIIFGLLAGAATVGILALTSKGTKTVPPPPGQSQLCVSTNTGFVDVDVDGQPFVMTILPGFPECGMVDNGQREICARDSIIGCNEEACLNVNVVSDMELSMNLTLLNNFWVSNETLPASIPADAWFLFEVEVTNFCDFDQNNVDYFVEFVPMSTGSTTISNTVSAPLVPAGASLLIGFDVPPGLPMDPIGYTAYLVASSVDPFTHPSADRLFVDTIITI